MSQLNFSWRYQPRLGSKTYLIIKYLQSRSGKQRSEMIQKALDGYYYPLAYSFANDNLCTRAIGYESILECIAQIEQICLICGVSSYALHKLLSSYFEDKEKIKEPEIQDKTPKMQNADPEAFDLNLLSFENYMIRVSDEFN